LRAQKNVQTRVFRWIILECKRALRARQTARSCAARRRSSHPAIRAGREKVLAVGAEVCMGFCPPPYDVTKMGRKSLQ
jgi:hypothetical protein